MDDLRNLRIDREAPGVMTVVVDMPDRSINVIDESLLRDLATLVELLEHDRSLNLVVFRSGKESGFLAGADVRQLQQITSPERAEIALRAGQQLLDRIAALPMLTVAVIHGPCLGGGLEFALACRFRVARDDLTTRIGFPETQLGVIPGWGGTQRLPRLVGLQAALRMILEGQRLPASKAHTLGLVDLAAPPAQFETAVRIFLTDRLAGKPVHRPHRSLAARWRDETGPGRWLVFRIARKRVGRRGRQYPALEAALRAVETGLIQGFVRGLAVEREEFCRVLFTSTCRRLLELFFHRERARKAASWCDNGDILPQQVKTVAVIGAGTMGAGIAQLAAYHGINVVLKDLRRELVDEGLTRIASLMQDAVRSGSLTAEEAKLVSERVSGTTAWDPTSSADLGIEAVVERLDVKQEVFRELGHQLPQSALIVSNTSALPVRELAVASGRPSQVAGLHFFNPVHRMPLVEVVRGDATSDETVATLVKLVGDLGKVGVVVADSPGFLVNRILFPYLDEAVRLVGEGVPADQVDRDAERFGMVMGPLEMLDLVGIDVASDIARTIAPLSADSSPTPQFLSAMVAEGRLGKKAGAGFYRYRRGRRRGAVSSTKPGHARLLLPAPAQFDEGESLSGIEQRLALAVINASAQCLLDQIVREPWIVDLAMVLGTGFAPFRGGPLRLADTWGLDHVVAALDQLAETCGPRYQPSPLLREMWRQGRIFYDGTAAATSWEPVAAGRQP